MKCLTCTVQFVELDMEMVRTKLNEYLSLKDNMVDRNILNRLVKTIYNREGNEFIWIINFTNLEIVDKTERIDKFSEEYRKYLKDDKNFNIFYDLRYRLMNVLNMRRS